MEKYGEALDLYNEYLEEYPNFPKEDIEIEKENVLELISDFI